MDQDMDNTHSVPHRLPVSGAPLSILIIEDNEEDYLHLHDLLARLGTAYFQVDRVRDFESGLNALTTRSYDVCLLDYQLGARTGLDLLRELSQSQETSTAMLMIAGVENPDIDKQALQAGAMDYLIKGELNPALIERSIRYALSHRLNQLALEDYAAELERKNQELAIARDDALEAIRLKAEFLSNMSHETRTPLNGIIGLLHLLHDTPLTNEQREALGSIKDCTETLLFMINNILDFSRIEEGQLELQHIDFDIRATIEEIVMHVTPYAHRKNLELVTVIHATVPTLLQGDPGRLRQIINNLLTNALKFSESGEINISITVESESDRGVFVKLSVTDNGVGISPEQQQIIFAPFTQGDGSSRRKYQGAGVGLSVAKHLTELMGGTIGVDSTVGQGSRFWVTIPFQRPAQSLSESPPIVFDARTLRAALICADPDQRVFFERQCRLWEVSLTSWPTGEEGLQGLQEASRRGMEFDVAIIDNSLPNANGFALAENIKAHRAFTHLPILMVTDGKRGEAKMAQEAGIAAYLTKPFHAWQFRECLRLMTHSSARDGTAPTRGLMTKHSLRDAQARDKTRILLVEENTVNQKVIIRALEKLGCRTDIVSSGQEAANAVQTHSYHAVLFDEWLSEFDQTSMAVLEEQLARACTPMILMRNAPTASDGIFSLNKPVVATLSKPVKLEELAAVISQWTRKNEITGNGNRLLTTRP